MINPSAAWERVKRLKAFGNYKLADFRPITYNTQFDLSTEETEGPTRRDFPGGAIILGITAGVVQKQQAYVADQTPNRNSFRINMSYTNDEQITPDGPLMADALLGGGNQTQFPPRELVVPATQGILVTCENLTTSDILVDIAFHCLVYRLIS